MTLRICTCGNKLTTKNVMHKFIQRIGNVILLMVNCPEPRCGSTVAIAKRIEDYHE